MQYRTACPVLGTGAWLQKAACHSAAESQGTRAPHQKPRLCSSMPGFPLGPWVSHLLPCSVVTASDISKVPPAPTASSGRGCDLTGRQQKKPRRQVRASEILRAFSCKSPRWYRMRGERKTRKSDVSTELFLCRIFFKDFNKGVCTKQTQLHLHS